MFSHLLNKIQSIGNFLQTPLLFLIRLYWGYQFSHAGYNKFLKIGSTTDFFHSLGILFPHLMSFIVGGIELIGGLLLIVGLFSRLISLPLFAVMVCAYILTELPALSALWSKQDPNLFFQASPFLFAYAAVIIFCFGPGKFSLDYLLNKKGC